MKILAIITVLVLTVSAVALAGQNVNLKVAVHVEAHNAKRSCGTLPAIGSCVDIVTTFAGYDFDAMPVFFDLYGITGAEYSLSWPAWTYSAAWTNCSDLVIGAIMWPGDSISHSWNFCQIQYAVICGWAWFYADGPGMMCMAPHGDSGFLGTTDCNFDIDVPITMYCAGVYGLIGDDPCEPNAVEPGTWGGIKGMFR